MILVINIKTIKATTLFRSLLLRNRDLKVQRLRKRLNTLLIKILYISLNPTPKFYKIKLIVESMS